jgi:hypothetical protein
VRYGKARAGRAEGEARQHPLDGSADDECEVPRWPSAGMGQTQVEWHRFSLHNHSDRHEAERNSETNRLALLILLYIYMYNSSNFIYMEKIEGKG